MTPRPPMPHETPLSPSEAAYLEHDYTLQTHDGISIEVCRNNDRNWQARPSLCHLANEQMGKRSARTCGFEGFGACGTSTEESK